MQIRIPPGTPPIFHRSEARAENRVSRRSFSEGGRKAQKFVQLSRRSAFTALQRDGEGGRKVYRELIRKRKSL